MKKQYEKLSIKIEEFNVIEAISSCNVNITTECNNVSGAMKDFLEELIDFPELFTDNCDIHFDDFGYDGEYCYHTPTGSTVIFSS